MFVFLLLLLPLLLRPSINLKRMYFLEQSPFLQIVLYFAVSFQEWHIFEVVAHDGQFEFRTAPIGVIEDVACRGVGVLLLHLGGGRVRVRVCSG